MRGKPLGQQSLSRSAYGLWAFCCVLLSAQSFIGSLQGQLFLARARAAFPLVFAPWSAPLDDVFIHFDFARSAARGHPFEWSEGAGYSSGGTSLLYPLVLAIGHALGFQATRLMHFALVVAAVSVLGLLLNTRRLFAALPPPAVYLLPPLLLAVGALSWTLWSGMETALLLFWWGACLASWHQSLARGLARRELSRWASALGLANALLVATRPEAVTTALIFALSGALWLERGQGLGSRLRYATQAALPPLLVVVGQAVANRILTGSFSAAGALTKLEIHDPLLGSHQVWERWLHHLHYQVARVSEYHLGDVPWSGWLLWVFSAAALCFGATRKYAALLWCQALAWVAVVALNGQVVWQNDRYTMPALAWLLIAAALGLARLLDYRAWQQLPVAAAPARQALGYLGPALSAVALWLFVTHQAPRYREQVWFFGRAARNIHDQQLETGLLLQKLRPVPRRVLVGDAGAIPYASDLPAFDLIGLGGFRGLPIAKAQRYGVGASVELIEHLPASERPDIFALYPSWWGDFPLWFGERLFEVPVRGNVICGGPSKVLYRADWSALSESDLPGDPALRPRLVDGFDVGDLLSEQAHAFELAGDAVPVTMKLLPQSAAGSRRALWDAGRLLASSASWVFELRGFEPGQPASLVLRTAPSEPAEWQLSVNGELIGMLGLSPGDSWRELQFTLPERVVEQQLTVELQAVRGWQVLYHVWGLRGP